MPISPSAAEGNAEGRRSVTKIRKREEKRGRARREKKGGCLRVGKRRFGPTGKGETCNWLVRRGIFTLEARKKMGKRNV